MVGVPLEQPEDQRLGLLHAQQPRRGLGEQWRLALQLEPQQLAHVLGEQRDASGEQLEQHHAERVEVRARVDRIPQRLFGRHVLGRAQHRAGQRIGAPLGVGDAEVEQLDLGRAGGSPAQEHVFRLEVAVHDLARVRGDQTGDDLLDDRKRFARRHVAPALERLRERLAGQKLHDVVGAARRQLAAVAEVHDVGMLERRRESRFLEQATHQGVRLPRIAAQHLDRDVFVQADVATAVHDPHRARPDLLVDSVAAVDHLADEVVVRHVGRPA